MDGDGDFANLLIPILIVQVSTAIIYSLFSAGVVFGYAAIKPILVNEGVYREHCPSPEYDNVERTCYEQEIRYKPHQFWFRTFINCIVLSD